MSVQGKAFKKYNIIISRLFQTIINLGEDQQLKLLKYAEELLIKEKRADIRKACSIPINFSADNRVFSNHIENITRNGLFIATEKPLNVGDEIIMTFNLQGFDKPFKIRGRIARAVPAGVGVQFQNISPYVEEMLAILVKRMK